MISIDHWMTDLTAKLKEAFSDRLLFVGLQGSYRRGEANENSDIDAVVILDVLSMGDLKAYRDIIETMPENEKACGFISGRQELMNWPKHELFQFKQDTVGLYGSLGDLLPEISRPDIIESVKIGVSEIYHACCHTYIHGEPAELAEAIRGFYKGAFFILQALHYLRSGIYAESKKELLHELAGLEQEILLICSDWEAYREQIAANPGLYCGKIIGWCADVLSCTF